MARSSDRIRNAPRIWVDYVRSENYDLEAKKSKSKIDKQKLHICGTCEHKFIHKSSLDIHIREFHRPIRSCIKAKNDTATIKEYKCKFCEVKFPNSNLLLTHRKTCAHKLVAIQKDKEPKVCFICSCSYVCQSSLNRHMNKVHGNTTQFQCKYCCKKFERNYQLKNHIKSDHDVLVIQQEGDCKFTLKVQNPKRDYSVSMHKIGNTDMIKIDDTSTAFSNFTKYFESTKCDTIEVKSFIGADTGSECLVICKASGNRIARDKVLISALL